MSQRLFLPARRRPSREASVRTPRLLPTPAVPAASAVSSEEDSPMPPFDPPGGARRAASQRHPACLERGTPVQRLVHSMGVPRLCTRRFRGAGDRRGVTDSSRPCSASAAVSKSAKQRRVSGLKGTEVVKLFSVRSETSKCHFSAPAQLSFRMAPAGCHIKPDPVKRWLSAPPAPAQGPEGRGGSCSHSP